MRRLLRKQLFIGKYVVNANSKKQMTQWTITLFLIAFLLLVIILELSLIALKAFSQSDYDTSKIAIIPLDTAESYSWRLKDNNPTTLTMTEINLADSIINVCISENNNNGKSTNSFGKHIGIHTFKKQLDPSINAKGEIIIWVSDGGVGGGLFNTMINLATRKYYKLYVNGM